MEKNNELWTIGSLKQYFDRIMADSDRSVANALAAAEKAVTKAEVAAEKRFDSVNEFRNALRDQQSTFADKSQTDFRLASIEKRLDSNTGRASGHSDVVAWIIAGLAILSSIASPVLAIIAMRGK